MLKDAREHAIQQLEARRFSIRPTKLVSLSIEYNITRLFVSAFCRLVKARLDDLTDDEYKAMPPRVWVAILRAQTTVRMHRHIVACEAPAMVHATSCAHHGYCEQDWKQLWWNGMGRFLLDGRCPQSYKNAIKRFEQMREIGDISPECWWGMMMKLRDNSASSAFSLEDIFIERTSHNLAQTLISYDNDSDIYAST